MLLDELNKAGWERGREAQRETTSVIYMVNTTEHEQN